MTEDLKQFIGNVVGTAVESAISQISASFVETTVRATIAAIREENKQMMSDTVKATIAEIRSEDPVYIASKKWDVIERMHKTNSLSQEQLESSQQSILNMLLPGTKGKSLLEKNLTHASDFLQEKLLQSYRWKYKTLESAAGQLTKSAKNIWKEDNYQAFKEAITLKSGRTVQAYVFPIKYAQKAFEKMIKLGKFYKDQSPVR